MNFATARGVGNGLAAVDTAIAYVLVGVAVVPPLIEIVKTPSPLTLPFNGGSVTYRYAVTNPGTVALSNVTVTDDKCSSVLFVSGNTNNNATLEPTETWIYTCTTTVPQTTVNTAIATGVGNGLTAIDTALATVVVAGSPTPPLIHIIKEPVPLILPAGGGLVAYTYTVTNAGTVPLNNVSVVDDTCSTMVPVSGDANGNGRLGVLETWTYRCQQTLTADTTNTATAQGSANGFTVTSVAVANVVLAAAPAPAVIPTLPNTGIGPDGKLATWMLAGAALFVTVTLLCAVSQRKRFFP